jgi:hypothetical protein
METDGGSMYSGRTGSVEAQVAKIFGVSDIFLLLEKKNEIRSLFISNK